MLSFLRLQISDITRDALISAILNSKTDQNIAGKAIHLVNAYTCTIFADKSNFNPLTTPSSLNVVDGFWLTKYLKFKYVDIAVGQIRGPSLFQDVLEHVDAPKIRHLFLGSTLHTQELMKEKLHNVSPNLKDAKFVSPAFKPITDEYIDEICKEVLDFRPDVVWVGLGTPKQDFIADAISTKLGILSVAVGAAFDFWAGNIAEAPKIFRKLGFEWLFRLLTEPKRLWKRYLIGNIEFVRLCALDWFRK